MAVALAALLFAGWVALWNTLGWPAGGPLVTLGFEPDDAIVVLAMSGVVATGAAILTGVAELYEALPPQHLEQLGVSNPRWRGGRVPEAIRLFIGGRNGDTYVASVRVDMILLNASGEEVKTYPSVAGGIELMPRQRFGRDNDVLRTDAEAAATIRLEWATERVRGLQHTEMAFPQLPPVPEDLVANP